MILLASDLHSILVVGAAPAEGMHASQRSMMRAAVGKKGFIGLNSLLVTQRIHGIEFGGARSRIEAGDQAYQDGETDGSCDQPPGNRRNLHTRKILPFEVNIRAERE